MVFGQIASAQQIKVMTYNIRVDFGGDGPNNWEFRRDFLADQIAYNNPDFIGTQEGKYHQLRFIDSTLTHHSYIGISRDNSEKEGEFSAIFYNTDRFQLLDQKTLWLSETPEKPSKAWDAAYPRIYTYGIFKEKKTGKKVLVFNTHLDHVGEVARKNSVEIICKKIREINKENLPVFITGDFNSEPSTGAYQTMITHFKDAKMLSKQKPFGPTGTFSNFKHNEPVTLLLDYIFVSPNAKVLNHAVLSDSKDCRYPSDHLPVMTTVEF